MNGAIYPPLALIGKAGAGKDTAAAELADMAGYTRYALADPLKDIAVQLWGEEARTNRYLLQNLGRKVREIREDTWVDVLLSQIDRVYDGPAGRAVVTDVRYPNEVQALGVNGFVTVRIDAPTDLRVTRLYANGKLQRMEDLDDDSETALDDYVAAYTVTNNGTPEELADQLATVLNRLAS